MQIEIFGINRDSSCSPRLLNYDDWRVAGQRSPRSFSTIQVVTSDIEAERDHLRVGDHSFVC